MDRHKFDINLISIDVDLILINHIDLSIDREIDIIKNMSLCISDFVYMTVWHGTGAFLPIVFQSPLC